MPINPEINSFLSKYDNQVYENALKLREILLTNLPDVIVQLDLPAKMVAYTYGQKYVEMICIIIPSKKDLKLAFYKGVDLPDPNNLLEGKAKLSRYVEIKSDKEIYSEALKQLIEKALDAYKKRMKK